MKILSVDLGARNLAWCVLERTSSKDDKWAVPPFHGMQISVCAWRNVDILEEAGVQEEVNLNKTDVAACVPWFVCAVRKHLREMTEGVEHAVLEAQPTSRVFTSGGRCISNIRTKVLSHVLQALLLDLHISVQFVNPAMKLKDAQHLMENPTEYRDHKKAAIALCSSACAVIGDFAHELWSTRKGKRDDLADALLQGICFKLTKSRKQKRKASAQMELDLDEIPAPPLKNRKKAKDKEDKNEVSRNCFEIDSK